MSLSIEQFMPVSEKPADLRKAIERQGLWIGGQNETNRIHWAEIVALKGAHAEERRDRMARDELILTTLESIKLQIARVETGSRLAVVVGRVAFAIAGLLVAAKAAGMF